MIDTLSRLREANLKRHKEWAKGAEISLTFRGCELAGEAGEACNNIKKLERERMGIVGSKISLEDIADELADVMICVDLIAMDLGIDMSGAITRKFNATSEKYGLNTKMK